jgi:hypothetical protein
MDAGIACLLSPPHALMEFSCHISSLLKTKGLNSALKFNVTRDGLWCGESEDSRVTRVVSQRPHNKLGVLGPPSHKLRQWLNSAYISCQVTFPALCYQFSATNAAGVRFPS